MLLVAEALGGDEIAALTEVIESGWITMGDRVRALKKPSPFITVRTTPSRSVPAPPACISPCAPWASVRATRFWCRP